MSVGVCSVRRPPLLLGVQLTRAAHSAIISMPCQQSLVCSDQFTRSGTPSLNSTAILQVLTSLSSAGPSADLLRFKHKQAQCAACSTLCADDSDGEEGTADAQPREAAHVPPSTFQPAGEAVGGARGAAGLPAAEALPGSPRVSAAFGNAVDSAPAQHSTAAVAVAEPAAELQRAALPGRGRGRGDAGQPAAAAAAAGRKLKRGGSGTNAVPRVTALGEWGCCHTDCPGA